MSKKEKDRGRFVLRLEYGWSEINVVDQVVDEAVNKHEDLLLLERGVAGWIASTVLGRFPSKSVARRVGAQLKGKMGEEVSNKVELRIKERRQ